MHIYELDGGKYPSVTTILKLLSMDDRLLKWANFMGFKHKDITKIQEESAEFGTLLHSQLRSIVDPKIECPDIIKDPRIEYDCNIIKKRFNEYFKDIKYRTIDTEMTLISKNLGYAGTLDWLTQISTQEGDKLTLLDFKTSKKVIPTMYLQLGGYYNLLKDININVDCAGIVIANTNECSLNPISKDLLEKYATTFLVLVDLYKKWNLISTVDVDIQLLKVLRKQEIK